MANDSNWGTKYGVELKDCNGIIGPRYEFIAQRDISRGEEIFISYNLEWSDLTSSSAVTESSGSAILYPDLHITNSASHSPSCIDTSPTTSTHAITVPKCKRATSLTDKTVRCGTPLTILRMDQSLNHHLQLTGKNARCAMHRWVGIETERDTYYCATCNVNICVPCSQIFHCVHDLMAIKYSLQRQYKQRKPRRKKK